MTVSQAPPPSTSPHPWLDVAHAPVYIARLPARCADAELIAYFQALEPFLRNHPGRYAFVTDASFVHSAPATQRRIAADSDLRMREHDRTWCAGVAIVAKTALMRGAITAVYWLSPPVYPYRIFPSLAEALPWARKQLEPTHPSLRPAP